MDEPIALALDFDGSLVEAHSQPLRWRPRAKDFVIAAAAAGMKLWLHSCRCQVAVALERELPGDPESFWRFGRVPEDVEYSWQLFEEMRAFLQAEGVWHLLTPWTLPGKPIAMMYPDDLGERPDWLALSGELGLALGHADEGRDRPLGSQGVAPPVDAGAGVSGGYGPAAAPVAITGEPATTAPGPGVVVAPLGDVYPRPGGGA